MCLRSICVFGGEMSRWEQVGGVVMGCGFEGDVENKKRWGIVWWHFDRNQFELSMLLGYEIYIKDGRRAPIALYVVLLSAIENAKAR